MVAAVGSSQKERCEIHRSSTERQRTRRMTMRSGTRYKMAEQGDRVEPGGKVASKRTASQKTARLRDGQASSETLQLMEKFMTQMLQLVSETTEQQKRVAFEEQAVERARQEEERKRLAELNATNMRTMMEQLREVMMPVDERRDSGCATGTAVEPKITRLSDADDIEAYLTTFERLMTVDSVDRATWAVRLVSTGVRRNAKDKDDGL